MIAEKKQIKLIDKETVHVWTPITLLLLTLMLSLVSYIYVSDKSADWRLRENDRLYLENQFKELSDNQKEIQREVISNEKATRLVLDEFRTERLRLVQENMIWREVHAAEQRALRVDVEHLKKRMR